MSKPEELEQRIREQRTIEANKKGFVGQNGKIGIILKMMGHPIIAQAEGGGLIDTNYLQYESQELDDPRNSIELMQGMPTMDLEGANRPEGEEWSELNEPISYGTYTLGWHFDGLSRGMHLEIKYDEIDAELSVSYKGRTVYKEIKGEIVSYVPHDEWEKWIESLSKIAKDAHRKLKEQEFSENIEKSEKQKANWLNSIRSRWGI